MIRRLTVTLAPSDALAALALLQSPSSTLRGAARAAAFGARLEQEVTRAFEALARPLEVLGQCLDWLARRGLCEAVRPRGRSSAREPAWRCEATVRCDVKALAREVADTRDDPDSKARASAWALRAVLRHLAASPTHEAEVKMGAERVPVAEALAAFDAVMAAAGYGPHAAPPARLAHLGTRTRRREEPAAPEPTPAPAPAPTKATSSKATSAKAASPSSEPAGKGSRRDAPKRDGARAKASAGFGGLPDDAEPEDRRAGEVYSARGVTLDAEFFLTEAGITSWPCDATTLERGRRAVITRLHPDRAGEASTTAFHRAIKGHADLLRKLPATPAPSAAKATTAPPEVAAAPPVTPSSVASHVAPHVEAAPEPTAPAKSPRRPRAKVSPATPTPAQATPASAPAPVPATATVTTQPSATTSHVARAGSTTFEWPPRPPPPSVPPPVEVPVARAPKRRVVAAAPVVDAPRSVAAAGRR